MSTATTAAASATTTIQQSGFSNNIAIGIAIFCSALIIAALLVVGITYHQRQTTDDKEQQLQQQPRLESKASLERLIATINRRSPYEPEMMIHRMNSPFTSVTIRKDSNEEPPAVSQISVNSNALNSNLGFYPNVQRGSHMYCEEFGNADTIKDVDTIKHINTMKVDSGLTTQTAYTLNRK